jgi:hypothetical protein
MSCPVRQRNCTELLASFTAIDNPRQDSEPVGRSPPPMALNANRTLVKSPPELWELVDDAEFMGRWCAALLGRPGALPVEVTLRAAEERIAWRCADTPGAIQMDLCLAEKGFGTNVAVAVASASPAALTPEALDELLDELAAPQRRPFTRA